MQNETGSLIYFGFLQPKAQQIEMTIFSITYWHHFWLTQNQTSKYLQRCATITHVCFYMPMPEYNAFILKSSLSFTTKRFNQLCYGTKWARYKEMFDYYTMLKLTFSFKNVQNLLKSSYLQSQVWMYF